MIDIKRKRKEEYEIDPNSSFNKLRKLQMALKEEVALTDIFFENRDDLLKKIESNCLDFYRERISIQEIYDHNGEQKNMNTEEKKQIKYEVSEKPQSELPQCYDPLYKLMFYFRNSNDLTLKLIQNCPKDSYELLANFICNYYYVNIFSSTFLNENLLTLIYLLLEKEIDMLTNEKSSFFNFLDSSKSFTAVLLKYLSRRDEVKTYLENVLKKLLIGTAGLLPNQKNKFFLGLDINKIRNYLTKMKYALPKTQKMTDTFGEILTMDIKKSRLNMDFMNYKNKNETENKNKNEDEDDMELTKEEIENNFYVQATKETFDDLLLGNEEEDDEIRMMLNNEEDAENKNQKKMNFFGGNAGHKKKREGKDDIENFLINSGFYNRPIVKGQSDEEKILEEEEDKKKEEENQFIEKNRDKIFNNLYNKDLNKETLLALLDTQDDDDMEEYLMNKIKNLQEGMNFTNINFINETLRSNGTKTFLEKIILIYKYHFEVIKQFIDELFTSLVKNKENTPYIIRAICTIISKLLEIKFPQITNNQKISFISEFLFTNLIIPILFNPDFNGIMMYNFEKEKEISNLRCSKIIIITKVIKKLLRGELYDGQKKNEENFTIFNPYFIEIMPHVIEFFRNISSTKLPINIEKLLEYRKNNSNSNNTPTNEAGDTNKKESPKEEKNIEFDFLKAHPEEKLEHQSMCITWKDFETIYNIIKSNESGIVGDKDGIVYKTYKKMTFHEATLKKKMDTDTNNSKRTYIYLAKLILVDELKEKIEAKRDKKFSFQSNETLSDANNETFILARVKYCINTIIKHLNALSRTNFFVDEKESTENFVKGLNKMISLEGFSEMLKEKALPLEWFGLYLQSNIENIPSEYKSNNYFKLYSELIEESNKNLDKIQNDNSLNMIYSKIINSEKMIDISKNNLKRIKSNEKKFEILDFILKTEIPVTINLYRNVDKEIKTIEFVKKGNKSNINPQEGEELTSKDCNNIVEFCEKFPYLSRENTTDITDILKFEEEIHLRDSLNDYFNIIHDYVKEEKMYKEYKDENEQTKIRIQIEDFIHAQLYDKIYSGMAVQDDIKIFQKCFTLKWVKPTMLNEKLTYLDEKMTQMMRSFIRNIDEEISPNNKLREFEKLDLIINNMITLYGYTKDVYLSIMIFAFIKGQPYQLNSCYRYIKMYYSQKLPKKRGEDLLKHFEKLLDKITHFSEKDLVGISKETYEQNIENLIKSMSSTG